MAPASAGEEELGSFRPPPASLTPLTIAGRPLRFVGSARDLGVEIDATLAFKKHCKILTKKAKRAAFQTLRCFQAGRVEPLLRAYKLYVRPKIEYASPIYSPVNLCDSKALESVQKYYTRALFAKCGLKPTSYANRLKFLKLDTLAARRIKFDLLFAHKIYHNEIPDCDILMRSNSIRGHRNNSHLLKEPSGCRERLNFFSNRVVNSWNSIPQDIISASYVKFKRYVGI